ncbi:hypothetical protein BGZ89_002109 [Linnemannia elongata]|nr:hypothetical protein BGZ89_002109 [Linnemannia elongata]
MSAGTQPIPVYNEACLATDSASNQTYFYLAGSPKPGTLTVHSFNNWGSPAEPFANQTDANAWGIGHKKLCFMQPNQLVPNPYKVSTNPIDIDQALLAVGAYGSFNDSTSQGYTVVFGRSRADRSISGAGQIFSTEGSLLPILNANMTTVSLTAPVNVSMNGITLTENAIPVTMGKRAYILDKGSNNLTVVYYIEPGTSSTLNLVDNAGGSLPFSSILAASALYNGILTYSSSNNVATFNLFDVTENTWRGNGVVSNPKSSLSTPIGAIIGGVAGGLIAIVLIVFFILRRRRQTASKASYGVELVQLNSDENKTTGTDQEYVQYDQGYVQYNQGSYDQGYQHPPSFIPPPPTSINQGADDLYKVDAPSSPTNPYVSPTSYRDSTSFPPASPESILAKSARSSVSQGPQYFPGGSVAVSEVRSPQTVPSRSFSP